MPKDEGVPCRSERDRAFVAEIPELAGCATDGKADPVALANVAVVIREWSETLGHQVPAQRPAGLRLG
jgi:predicted RNase H-like HicB family nuclease